MFLTKKILNVSGLVLISAISFVPKAHAQVVTQDIPFTGTITGTCTFGVLSGGTLAKLNSLNAVEGTTGLTGFGIGNAGKTTLTCTAGGSLAVSAPTPGAVPAGWAPPVRQAVVQLGANFTSASAGGDFDTVMWARPTAPLVIPAGATQTLSVGMVAGTNAAGTPPSGTYNYTVRLSATPN